MDQFGLHYDHRVGFHFALEFKLLIFHYQLDCFERELCKQAVFRK